MVGVVVGRKNTFNRHSVGFDNVDEIIDMPCRVDEHTRSGCSVTDRIRKVDHLRREVITDGKVAAGEQLAEVETVVFHGFERTLHSVEMSDSAVVDTDRVRYGVIGTGMMGVEHIENILHLDGTTVSAIADTNAERREIGAEVVRHLGGDDVVEFADHRTMLDSCLVDAVVIVTPNMTHADVLSDVLATDVHVMVEKPLCTTVADCQRVIAAETSGNAQRVVWMGLEYRYMPPTTALLNEIRSGTVGNVKMVSIREHRFPFLQKVDDWNRFNRNTGGTFVEKCCHFFDLMRLIADAEPARVYASGAQDVNHLDESYNGEIPDVLDNGFVVVDFDNGVRGLLDLCMFAEASKNEQEISVTGDEGKVEAIVTESLLRIGRRADGQHVVSERSITDDRIRHVGLHNGASYLEHVDFLAAIRRGEAAKVTLLDGMRSVAIGVAAHRSIECGRPVEMSEVI